jgi:hypothetical protein
MQKYSNCTSQTAPNMSISPEIMVRILSKHDHAKSLPIEFQ